MISDNYRLLMDNVSQAARSSGRLPKDVRLVAVTKTVGMEEIRQCIHLGITDFGENRLQDALPKFKEFPRVNWHFIGHLQSNKARAVVEHCRFIHSLDRRSLARAIQHSGEQLNKEVNCLVQVNISAEKSKHGLAPEELSAFLAVLKEYPRIKVWGLMGMAPIVENPAEARPYFQRLWQLKLDLATPELPLSELSMGMTNDYLVAIAEGATMIRVGSALFKTNMGG